MPVKRKGKGKLTRGRPRTRSQSSPRTRGRPRLSKKSRVRRRRRSLRGGATHNEPIIPQNRSPYENERKQRDERITQQRVTAKAAAAADAAAATTAAAAADLESIRKRNVQIRTIINELKEVFSKECQNKKILQYIKEYYKFRQHEIKDSSGEPLLFPKEPTELLDPLNPWYGFKDGDKCDGEDTTKKRSEVNKYSDTYWINLISPLSITLGPETEFTKMLSMIKYNKFIDITTLK
jgi:hypothetical protein